MPLIALHELTPDRGGIPVYNGKDSLQTHAIHTRTRDEFAGQESLIYGFSRGLQAPALEMMLRGFRVDPWARDSALRATKVKHEAAMAVLLKLVDALIPDYKPRYAKDGGWTLPNSNSQLPDLFYNRLGLTPLKTYYDGIEKTPMDRKILERLEDHFYARPFVNAILLVRDLEGILEVLETEIDSDWRWRCSYNIAGTTTGRWSSSKSGVGTGSNFQNISDELRRIFIADPGYKLCGIDLEQAEAREVGWFCGTVLGDWSYLDMLEAGDIHTQIARMCWPDLDWTGNLAKDRNIANRKFYRHFTYRDATKRLAHGSTYMGKPPTMSSHTKIPLNIVRPFQDRFFERLPCIPRMHHWIARELQTKGFLTNAFGRRRDFFDRAKSDETLKGAVAHMFQSATGDRLNLGLWRIWKHMGCRVQLLAQLHDALYFQYRLDDDETEVITQAMKLMEVELEYQGRKFIVPGEAQTGFNWAHRFRLREDGSLDDWNKKGLDKWRPN